MPNYWPDAIVQDDTGDLTVTGYSVPEVADWNNDGLFDLIVGEGGGGVADAKVRIYLNAGTMGFPVFSDFEFAQIPSGDLTLPASGCLGLFPRIVDWNEDQRKDLLIGTASGYVMVFLNLATDGAPTFDSGTNLQVGQEGFKVDINVAARATPSTVDWDNDGTKDLLVGALDGKVRWYQNTGTNSTPDFEVVAFVQDQGGDLIVPTLRSSPLVGDFDNDGNKDLICGNTNGHLLFYTNLGTDAAPVFGVPENLSAGGVVIDLDGFARSRPCTLDWGGDGVLDLLVGAADGKLHLFNGQMESPVDLLDPIIAWLHPPFPNPFNPRTTIGFSIEQAGQIDLAVFDLAGRRVLTLEQGFFEPGEHSAQWFGRNDRGQIVASGTYFVRMQTDRKVEIQKITLVQ